MTSILLIRTMTSSMSVLLRRGQILNSIRQARCLQTSVKRMANQERIKVNVESEESPQSKRLTQVVNISVAVFVYSLFGLVLYFVYVKIRNRRRRQALIEEYLPDSRYIHADLPLVRYKGCVLSKDIIINGVMENIEKFQLRSDDVIVASFPKSGTTWLQEIVYQLKSGKDETSDEVMETIFPYLEFPYPGLKDIEVRKGGRLIKTHLPCRLLPESVNVTKPKVLYIYRNPKDVAVSYYHFARMLNFVKFRGKFEKFANLMMKDRVPYGPYFPHLHEYLKMTRENPEQFLGVSYEELQEKPAEVIERIAKFLKVEVDQEDVERLVDLTSFEQMKKNPRTNYEHWDIWGIRNPRESSFMRKGKVGNHEDYFDNENLKERFDAWISQGTANKTSLQFKFHLTEDKVDTKIINVSS